jgi:DNA-binding beta-propeller fold protein YncE
MTTRHSHGSGLAVLAAATVALGGCAAAGAAPAAGPEAGAPYAAYVVSEAADVVARIGFGPDGARIEREQQVSTRPHENDGPHGVAVAPDGRYYYVSIGHGTPFGSLWKLDAATDEIVARVTLGLFPATVDVTPDGEFGFVSNFNLHGDHVPSSVSKVHLPTMTEVARIETCVMPHGSRVTADGTRHYSVCMMDQMLVEIDVASRSVARFFSVAPGAEGPAERPHPPVHHPGEPAHTRGHDAPRDPRAAYGPDTARVAHPHAAHGAAPAAAPARLCSPTWAQPSPDGTRIFVACNGTSEVLEIDAARWSLLRRFPTGEGPYNVDVTPDGRLLLVTLKNRSAPATEIVDLDRGETVARVPASTTLPHGIAISADSRFAFVSVEGVGAEPGRVDVIDLHRFDRVASVEVGQQAAGIAVTRTIEK